MRPQLPVQGHHIAHIPLGTQGVRLHCGHLLPQAWIKLNEVQCREATPPAPFMISYLNAALKCSMYTLHTDCTIASVLL
jgi:hypothetical protein